MLLKADPSFQTAVVSDRRLGLGRAPAVLTGYSEGKLKPSEKRLDFGGLTEARALQVLSFLI